jgi:hypothetical protein
LNAYLICLRFTQGSTIKRTFQVRRSVLGRFQSGGVSLRTIHLGGAALDGKIPFPLMTKGERFIDAEHRGMVLGGGYSQGSMSDMTSVLHDMTSVLHQSVSINAKGGDC